MDDAGRTRHPRTPSAARRHPDRSRPTFDPAQTALAWALATGPGRIPVL
ncbi:MAG: hypothetical protein AB1679_17455 [Actinomycetota bacterium]|jgi:hypothetical protein